MLLSDFQNPCTVGFGEVDRQICTILETCLTFQVLFCLHKISICEARLFNVAL